VGGVSNPKPFHEPQDFVVSPHPGRKTPKVLGFVEWLRVRNAAHAHPATKARFYGLDLYSLRASMEAVVDYLDRVDPDEATRARARYSCFDHVGG